MAWLVLIVQLAVLWLVGFLAPTKLGVARYKKAGVASWWIYLLFFLATWILQAFLAIFTVGYIRQLPPLVDALPDFAVFVFPIAAFCYRKKACEKG